MPTIPIGPPPVDVDEVSLRGTVFAHTQLFNHLGWPSITIPCGRDADGMPVGMMLSGPGDDVVLGAALALEGAIRGCLAGGGPSAIATSCRHRSPTSAGSSVYIDGLKQIDV